ncbi:MAG TPA: hypothetical protein VND45_02655, partial [Thermoanaerobaculia bacterium]|nr:hypothetical protein [Thermoanaerobaculia bacterium]
LQDAPLPGVTVRVAGQSVLTDVQGRYVFFAVPDGEHEVALELAGLGAAPLTLQVAGHDVTVPPQAMHSVATNCAMTIEFCRDTPSETAFDYAPCDESHENRALAERNELGALRARYHATASIAERHILAGQLLRRVPDDGAIWDELAQYAEVAVRNPMVDGELSPAFIAWSEERNVEPDVAWRVVSSAFGIAADDPRARPMIRRVLATGERDMVLYAILGLVTQRDRSARSAIAAARKRFPADDTFDENTLIGDATLTR